MDFFFQDRIIETTHAHNYKRTEYLFSMVPALLCSVRFNKIRVKHSNLIPMTYKRLASVHIIDFKIYVQSVVQVPN